MKFDTEEYILVERSLLGLDKFNELQREFIELFETKTIIAGPGAGKTTALVAKIVLLLKQLNKSGSKDGVCIITHTNVAVEEINNTLREFGISNIDHPHFIGTIHEFFNKFCVVPYFKNTLQHNTLLFDSEHLTDEEFFENYLTRTEAWMSEGVRKSIAKRIHKSDLYFNDDLKSLDLLNTSKWNEEKFFRYKDMMLLAKVNRKKQGFLQYDDTFVFSKLFLINLKYKSILKTRFKYIFIDEFQDTSPIGGKLIEEVFNSENNILQKIGDPYQTITYGQPMPVVMEHQTLFLNLTNRFGSQIAQPLNVIMPDANIKSSENRVSFKPIILLYTEEEAIYESYKSIIAEFERQDDTFKNSSKKDKVLVWAKKWISIIKPGLVYRDKKLKKLETPNARLKALIINFVISKVLNSGGTSTELRNWAKNYSEIIELNNILLKILKRGINAEDKEKIKVFIIKMLEEKGITITAIDNNLFEKMEDILSSSFDFDGGEEGYDDDVYTIHSVKGETLRSALVVDFNEGLLTKILLSKYELNDRLDYSHTDHNLLYVAMSRVTHLFIFAIHKDKIKESERNIMQTHWLFREI